MDLIKSIIMVLQVLSSIGLIVLVLLQHGKGADAGATFGGGGGGASGSVFGSVGSANFMSRTTAYLATLFIVCTVSLAFVFSGTSTKSGSVLDGVTPVVAPSASPVAPKAADGVPK